MREDLAEDPNERWGKSVLVRVYHYESRRRADYLVMQSGCDKTDLFTLEGIFFFSFFLFSEFFQ